MYQVLLFKFWRHFVQRVYDRLSAPRFPNHVYFSLKTVFLRSDLERVKSQPTLLDFDGMIKDEFTG